MLSFNTNLIIMMKTKFKILNNNLKVVFYYYYY